MDGVLLAWKMLLYVHMEAEQESPTDRVDMATLQPGMFTSSKKVKVQRVCLLMCWSPVGALGHLCC